MLNGVYLGPCDQSSRRLAVIGDQTFQIQALDLPVDHSPFARDHHPIRTIRTTQQQRRNRHDRPTNGDNVTL